MKSFLSELFPHVIFPAKGKSEINQFDGEILLVNEHNVFKFEITMTDVLWVKIFEGSQQLYEHNFRFSFGKFFTLANNCK